MEKKKRITIVLFVIYLVILSWIIVFKMSFSIAELGYYRNINLIPFKESVIVNGRLELSEIFQNILAFVPFGIYLSMIDSKESFFKKVLTVFFVSLTYEVMQYVLAVGASDITDLIDNTLGGAIGIIVYIGFAKVFKTKTDKILNILAACGTIVLIGLIIVLIVLNI